MIIISTSFVLLYGSQNAYEMFTQSCLNVKGGCIYLFELNFFITSCIFKRNTNLYRINEKIHYVKFTKSARIGGVY